MGLFDGQGAGWGDPMTMALLGMAGAFGQAAMPSRLPVPLGAVLGAGAAGAAQGARSSYDIQNEQAKSDLYRAQVDEAKRKTGVLGLIDANMLNRIFGGSARGAAPASAPAQATWGALAPGSTSGAGGSGLLAALVPQAAASVLPAGYKAVVTSQDRPGARVAGTGGTSQHALGNALDVQIIGPDGTPIPNKGEDTTGLYGRLATGLRQIMPEAMRPNLAWGGNFTTGPENGPRDLMHFDLAGDRGRFGTLAQMTQSGPVAQPGGGGGPRINMDALTKARVILALGGITGDPLGSVADRYYKSPEYLAQTEAAKRGAGFPFDAAKARLDADLANANAWRGPSASPELQAKLAAAKTDAERNSLLLAAGLRPGSPEANAAVRNSMTDTRPSDIQIAEVYRTGTKEQQDAMQRAQASGRPVNLGAIPQDYQAVPTADGGFRMVVIPDSPTDRAMKARDKGARLSGGIVTEDIARALPLVNWWTTGPLGSLTQYALGSESHQLSTFISGLESNVIIDRLNAMRQTSPSGGAMGNLTEKEGERLAATLGSLKQSQKPDDLRHNLVRLGNIYADMAYGTPEEIGDMLRSGKITQQQHDAQLLLNKSAKDKIDQANGPPVTITGPNNEKMILQNGQWVPLPAGR